MRPARSASHPQPTIGDVLTELRELRALIEARLSVPSPVEPPPYLTADEAAKLALRSPQTITAWCRSADIGGRLTAGGRWRVDRKQLRRFMVERFGEARLPPGLR